MVAALAAEHTAHQSQQGPEVWAAELAGLEPGGAPDGRRRARPPAVAPGRPLEEFVMFLWHGLQAVPGPVPISAAAAKRARRLRSEPRAGTGTAGRGPLADPVTLRLAHSQA